MKQQRNAKGSPTTNKDQDFAILKIVKADAPAGPSETPGG
jgi:hypothetical protein